MDVIQAFEVKDPKRLETEILPIFFRHCRFQSLVRQLNFYAFKKVSKERSSWVYSHEYFRRDRPELLHRMRRKTNNHSAKRNRRDGVSKGKTHFISQSQYSSDDSSEESYDNDGVNTSGSYHLTPLNEPNSASEGSCDTPNYNGSGSSCDSEGLQSDDEVDYEEVLGSWDNVHQFFLSGATGNKDSLSLMKVEGNRGAVDVLCTTVSDDTTESAREASLKHLLTFCLSRNPWQDTQALFADIHGLLSDNADMTNELNAYASALAPPSTLSLVVHRTMQQSSEVQLSPSHSGDCTIAPCILRSNEITLVRTFIAFALACLHDACHSEHVVGPPHFPDGHSQVEAYKSALGMCVDNWSSYAKTCT